MIITQMLYRCYTKYTGVLLNHLVALPDLFTIDRFILLRVQKGGQFLCQRIMPSE
jgi:hypothetical protein